MAYLGPSNDFCRACILLILWSERAFYMGALGPTHLTYANTAGSAVITTKLVPDS